MPKVSSGSSFVSPTIGTAKVTLDWPAGMVRPTRSVASKSTPSVAVPVEHWHTRTLKVTGATAGYDRPTVTVAWVVPALPSNSVTSWMLATGLALYTAACASTMPVPQPVAQPLVNGRTLPLRSDSTRAGEF